MTNINEKSEQLDMHLHIEKAFKIIDDHLPTFYVDKALEKLPDPKPSKGQIRNVRMRLNQSYEKRIDIITVLVELALENKAKKNRLASLVK